MSSAQDNKIYQRQSQNSKPADLALVHATIDQAILFLGLIQRKDA